MLERTLSKDMTALSAYLQIWQLKLNHAKMMTAAFHFYNQDIKRELKDKNNGTILPFCSLPAYFRVKLDRALTYHHHLEALHQKLSTRVSLLRRPTGSGWGAGARHCAQLLCP